MVRHQVSLRVRNSDGCGTEDVAIPAYFSAVSILFSNDHHVNVLLETGLSKQVLGRLAPIQVSLQNLYWERQYFAWAFRKTLQRPDPTATPVAPGALVGTLAGSTLVAIAKALETASNLLLPFQPTADAPNADAR